MDPRTLQFRLTINCDNQAFEDGAEIEIARILRKTADRLEAGESFDCYLNLKDYNGNTVGQAALKTVEEHDGGRRHDRKARSAR